jgi:glycosyltransferase involved in cell wall biosynthesis
VRILYFSDNCSDHNRRFLEKLASLEHDVYFLDATQTEVAENWLPRGVQNLQSKQSVPKNGNPSQFAGFLSEFQSVLRDLQPDIVHAGPVQTCGYVAGLSGFHPSVVMSWGSDILVDADRNAEWKRATEVALREADGFFCDCETVRESARRHVAIPDFRIVQFPWGVKRGSFSPHGSAESRESLGFSPEAFVFISTRSWEPIYDIEVLLQAFNWAYRENDRLRLLLLGNGSLAGRVRSFIIENKLENAIVSTGVIAGTQTPRWFRAANAYVSCARSDGTSVSLLEAMATGLPVVVTDIPSNREWITEQENGWLAATGSAEKFAEKLLRTASLSPDDLGSISERNRHLVAERADWDKNFPSLLRLYESLVSRAVIKT